MQLLSFEDATDVLNSPSINVLVLSVWVSNLTLTLKEDVVTRSYAHLLCCLNCLILVHLALPLFTMRVAPTALMVSVSFRRQFVAGPP